MLRLSIQTEWHCFDRTGWLADSQENSLSQPIPVTDANVNHLQRKDLYRGFESSSLRHAVWTAENSYGSSLEMRETCPYSREFPLKSDWRERTARHSIRSLSGHFSGRQERGPVSTTRQGECNAIIKPMKWPRRGDTSQHTHTSSSFPGAALDCDSLPVSSSTSPLLQRLKSSRFWPEDIDCEMPATRTGARLAGMREYLFLVFRGIHPETAEE
jgi:hypothetical protein